MRIFNFDFILLLFPSRVFYPHISSHKMRTFNIYIYIFIYTKNEKENLSLSRRFVLNNSKVLVVRSCFCIINDI